MNLENILAALLLLMSGWFFYAHIRDSRLLGKLIIPCRSGIRSVGFNSVIIILLMPVAGVMIILSKELDAEYMLGKYMLFGAVLLFTVTHVLQLISQKGFYDNGVATKGNVVLYQYVRFYDVSEIYGKDSVKIRFNSHSGRFVGSSLYVEADKKRLGEIKALLKKKCSFGKDRAAAPARKK